MKKIKNILIGTNNKGKVKEFYFLLNKKIKKFSPFQLNIKSPAETGKNFRSNSVLKAKFFFQRSELASKYWEKYTFSDKYLIYKSKFNTYVNVMNFKKTV